MIKQLAWRMAALIWSLAIICHYTADDVYAADQDNCESTVFDMNISIHADASACDEPSKPDMERINKILVNSGLSKKNRRKKIYCILLRSVHFRHMRRIGKSRIFHNIQYR